MFHGSSVSHIRFSDFYQNITRRAHVYPPLELYEPVSKELILEGWSEFAKSPSHHTLGLYIHIPFCFKKCSFCYCDTRISSQLEDFDSYLQALYNEMSLYAKVLSQRTVNSIYLGGGTPTHIGPERLQTLFETIHQTFTISPKCFVNV